MYIWTETDTGDVYVWEPTNATWLLISSAAPAAAGVSMPQGRLTLTTGVPVLVTGVTGATTIYYTPYKGAYVPIWGGASTTMTLITELSQTTTDNTKSPAACANNSNYDLFVWSNGGTKRCTRGPAWTSDTGRGTGAGTTQITRNTDGYYTNTVAITNGPGAGLGTYVGTVRTNGAAAVDMIFGGAGAAGGESTNLGVWNMYNRVPRALLNVDNTDNWNYTTATWRLKNAGASATANRITFVIGLQEDEITAVNAVSTTNGGIARAASVGLNSTSAYAGFNAPSCFSNEPSVMLCSIYRGLAPLGFNYLAPLEISAASGTTTWYGDDGADGTFTTLKIAGLFQASIMA
jgi:hypothetical protein